MRDFDALFEALARSRFRQRFALARREADYLRRKGMETVFEHGRDFIAARLAPPARRSREVFTDPGITPYSWLSTQPPPAAASACRAGTAFRLDGRCQPQSSLTPWP